MSLFARFLSFRPVMALGVLALLAACTAKTSSSPAQECTSQTYPNLACGSIKACANGKGNTCTSATLELPDGRKFTCASCSECKQAQDDALAACDNKEATPPATEADAAAPEADAAPEEGN